MDIFDEIYDLSHQLKDVQRRSKALLEDDDSSKKFKTFNDEKKREKASSAWAKSQSSRHIRDKVSKGEIISDECLKQAERIVRWRPPSYSIGKVSTSSNSKKQKTKDIYLTAPSPTAYRVNDSSLSRNKRSKSSTFGTAPRGDASNMVPIIVNQPSNEGSLIEEVEVQYDVEYPRAKCYSFGTSKRSIPGSHDCPVNEQHATPLNIHEADKWVYCRPMTPLMRDKVSRKETIAVSEKPDSTPTNIGLNVNISVLSHVIKSPVHSIRRPLPKSDKLVAYEASKAHDTLIGPGTYTIQDDIATQLQRKTSGKIYQKASPEAELALLKKHISELHAAKSIGPGYYDAAASADKLRTKTPTALIPRPKEDDDKSIHIQRKRYYEEKAADAREYHDNQVETNDEILRPRVQSAVAYRNDSILDTDAKLNRIHKQREAERIAQESNRGAYDINYEQIEQRPRIIVDMTAATQSRESTQKMISSKPSVQEAILEKAKPRDLLYGPQLPVTWAPHLSGQNITIESSPTREVIKILRKQQESYESSTSRAFLQSSLSGTISNKPTAIMREESPTRSKKIPEENPDVEPLGPIDWIEEINSRYAQHKNNVIRMDISRGRDEIRVRSKGLVEVSEFTNTQLPHREDSADLHHVNYPVFGSDAKGVIRFDKYTSRDDLMYPDDLYDGNNVEEKLDIDRNNVLDNENLIQKRTPNITLYRKDRFEEKKIEESEHVGGTWYKGMAHEVAKQRPVIDFSKMQGRLDSQTDKGMDEEGRVLDLEFRDVKDLSKKESKFLKFTDPSNFPRFEGNDHSDENALDLAPNYTVIEKNRFLPADVRMDRMTGRDGFDSDGDIGNDNIRTRDIVAHDQQISENATKAYESSILRRTNISVNMLKQRGRYDDEVKVSDEMMIDESELRKIDGVNNTRIKGHNDWSKQASRDLNERPDEDIEIIDLDNIQVSNQSKYKRPASALAWKLANDETRFAIAKPLAAADAIYDDIDPGKHKKKSLGPLGSRSEVNMQKQNGRLDLENIMESNKSVELDISPDDHLTRRRIPGGKMSSYPPEKSELVDVSLLQSTELDLEVKDISEKRKPPISMNKQSRRRSSAIPVEMRYELPPSKEVLILDPRPDVSSTARKPVTAIVPKGHDAALDNYHITDEDPFISNKPSKQPNVNPGRAKSSNDRRNVAPLGKMKAPTDSKANPTNEIKLPSREVRKPKVYELSPPAIDIPSAPARVPENFDEASANELFLQLDKQLSELNMDGK